MCPEALIEHIDSVAKIYQSERFPGVCIRSAYAADDTQLISLYAEELPCEYFNLYMQREPSYLDVSHVQYNRSETKVIVLEKHPHEVIGMLNIGWKYCYINEKTDLIRYISDLKIHPKFRRRNLLNFIFEYLKETLPKDSLVQSVIFNQHQQLQNILYDARPNVPASFVFDTVNICTLCYLPKPKAFENYRFEELTRSQIPSVHDFLNSLKTNYNFLPNYDFYPLVDGKHPYWRGMRLSDFYVMYNNQHHVVGIYGLWDQQKFKQIYIGSYRSMYQYIRPFYNLFANFTLRLPCPAVGQSLNYFMLHSALCRVEDHQAFSCLLYHALRSTRMRKKDGCTLALAESDPRAKVLKQAHYSYIQAQHSLHSFYINPWSVFDRRKISYFEVSRL
jgi:hypothetical protein